MSVEIYKTGTKKRPDGLSLPNLNTRIIIYIYIYIYIHYKKFKKYNEIQLTKNKMDEQSKMKNNPASIENKNVKLV